MSNYERDKERRELLKSCGLCPRCGRIIYDKNYITCEICRAKNLEENKDRYKNLSEHKKEEYKKNKRLKYEKLLKSGLCVICGKNPQYNGYVRCQSCYIKSKQKSERYKAKVRKGFKDLGLCTICGEPTVDGKSYCSKHLKEKQETLAETRKKINRKNHIWKQLNNKTFNNGGESNGL